MIKWDPTVWEKPYKKIVQSIPDKAHPFVQFIFRVLLKRGMGVKELEELTKKNGKRGVSKKTFINWRLYYNTSSPNLGKLEKALDALGYELVIMRKKR